MYKMHSPDIWQIEDEGGVKYVSHSPLSLGFGMFDKSGKYR